MSANRWVWFALLPLAALVMSDLKSKVNLRLASATWVLSSNSLVLAHTVKYYNQEVGGGAGEWSEGSGKGSAAF
jgi:hypothetical protein